MSDELDRWLGEATPDEVTVNVPLNRRLVAEYRKASEELLAARERSGSQQLLDGEPPDVVSLAERVVELEKQVDESARRFTFRCLEWERRRELARQHPPTDEQRKVQEQRNATLPPEQRMPPEAMVDPDGFYPALLSACCVSPGMSVEQAKKLRDVLPEAVWQDLVDAVQQVNVEGTSIPKYERSIAAMLRSELNSTTPPDTASLSPSSEDEG